MLCTKWFLFFLHSSKAYIVVVIISTAASPQINPCRMKASSWMLWTIIYHTVECGLVDRCSPLSVSVFAAPADFWIKEILFYASFKQSFFSFKLQLDTVLREMSTLYSTGTVCKQDDHFNCLPLEPGKIYKQVPVSFVRLSEGPSLSDYISLPHQVWQTMGLYLVGPRR